jgi:hypothetical protein
MTPTDHNILGLLKCTAATALNTANHLERLTKFCDCAGCATCAPTIIDLLCETAAHCETTLTLLEQFRTHLESKPTHKKEN